MDFFHDEISSSSTSWMLQSSYCSCGKHTGFFHCADPAIGVHACMHAVIADSRTSSSLQRMTSLDDVTPSSSPSGANKLACAYCQASPAALVASPSPVASLSSLDHPIWSKTDGDVNLPSALVFPLFLHSFCEIDPHSHKGQNVSRIFC